MLVRYEILVKVQINYVFCLFLAKANLDREMLRHLCTKSFILNEDYYFFASATT